MEPVNNIEVITAFIERKTLTTIEGFYAKKDVLYIPFWVDFHFLQDQANIWQTDLKNIVP